MVHELRSGASLRWRGTILGMVVVFALVGGLAGVAGTEAAQPSAPRPGCLPGDTPGDRIDAVIGILVGHTAPPAHLSESSAFADCPAAFILPYMEGDNFGSWLGMDKDEVWARYQAGDSLAAIAKSLGKDRADAVAALQHLYGAALDRARAAGAITVRQRQRIADAILPQFGWLVDWVHGNVLGVATGDVNLDAVASLVAACVPGGDDTARTDNLVRLVLGLTVDGLGGAAAFDDCTGPFGVIGQSSVPVVLTGILGSDEYFQRYLDGASLEDVILERHDRAFLDGLYRDIKNRIDQAVAAAVQGGRLSAADGDRVGQEAFLVIVVTLGHHHGDPLPSSANWTAPDTDIETAG
ncbi:MAG TPA: hypothetical protein VH482_16575 [Thermomicrobiales bacterium]